MFQCETHAILTQSTRDRPDLNVRCRCSPCKDVYEKTGLWSHKTDDRELKHMASCGGEIVGSWFRNSFDVLHREIKNKCDF